MWPVFVDQVMHVNEENVDIFDFIIALCKRERERADHLSS